MKVTTNGSTRKTRIDLLDQRREQAIVHMTRRIADLTPQLTDETLPARERVKIKQTIIFLTEVRDTTQNRLPRQMSR